MGWKQMIVEEGGIQANCCLTDPVGDCSDSCPVNGLVTRELAQRLAAVSHATPVSLKQVGATMGMNVLGNYPTAEVGKLFDTSSEEWSGAADYARAVAPEITKACKWWYSSDYDGLNAEGAKRLADRLEEKIDSGHALAYEIWCDEQSAGRPGEQRYRFSVNYLKQVVAFLRACGGFRIGWG
jgi:hypothetical protein